MIIMKETWIRKHRVNLVNFIAALIGLVVANIIMFEKLQLAMNSSYQTSCSFNPLISCSPVMSSPQAAAFFGFPNPLLGIMGFSVLTFFFFLKFFTEPPRWMNWVAFGGTAGALVFCFWLATQALYVIGALCIYCCMVWVCVTFLFWFQMKSLLGKTFWWSALATNLGLVLTLTAFGFMVFFAFPQYWLSLLG